MQRGNAHLPVLLACIVIVVIFAIGWAINQRQASDDDSSGVPLPAGRAADVTDTADDTDAAHTRWEYDGSSLTWQADGPEPPACPARLLAHSPVDTSLASAVSLPGQYRGGAYLSYGGFRFDGQPEPIEVSLPFDARLYSVTRESGTTPRYGLTFQHDCGYLLQFGGLTGLSAALEAAVGSADQTDGTPLAHQPPSKAGTAVGSVDTSVDIGLYDLRRPNASSKRSDWAAVHRAGSSRTYHGVCWLTMLPARDAATAKRLMARLPADVGGASDYCSGAPGGSSTPPSGS